MSHVKYAYVRTYGCQQNENDSDKIKYQLTQMGYALCDSADEADVIVFNTCSVREHAAQKVYSHIGLLRPLKARKPDLLIIIAGCLTQTQSIAMHIRERHEHVDVVMGTNRIHALPELIAEAQHRRITDVSADDNIYELPASKQGLCATVSVMYGCDNYCSYCIVPYVRGRERSREPQAVLDEVAACVGQGSVQVMLLGQNVNSYGYGLSSPVTFAQLLRKVNDVPGVGRIRFMTSHPKDVADDLIAAIAECDHVCKTIHLPFQSGSDKVLVDMNRRYTVERYRDIVRRLREAVPHMAITSDVIVGFPTETQSDFEDTMALIEEVRFDALFTFKYSPREGTAAYGLPPLDDDTVSARFDRLLKRQQSMTKDKHLSLIGSAQHVLVEGYSKTDGGKLWGRDDAGRVVNIVGGRDAHIGHIWPVRIDDANLSCLFGSIL